MESMPARMARFAPVAPCAWAAVLRAKRVRFIHQRVEFGLRQLRRIHVVGEREHAAGGAGLDHIGAVFDVVADGPARRVGAIDDAIGDSRFVPEQAGYEIRPADRNGRRWRPARAPKPAFAARRSCPP